MSLLTERENEGFHQGTIKKTKCMGICSKLENTKVIHICRQDDFYYLTDTTSGEIPQRRGIHDQVSKNGIDSKK